MIGTWVVPRRASANDSTIDSMRVGSCHATGVSGVTPSADQAGGHPLAPVAELSERDRAVGLVDEHGRVRRLLRAPIQQLPQGLRVVDHGA